MENNEIFAINHCDEIFYVDKYKILYVLSKLSNYNAFQLPNKNIIELIKQYDLLDKNLFARINKT